MANPLIMVVEDEVDQNNMIAKLIEATGRYETAKAYNAKEAFEILNSNKVWFRPNKVRLILLDIKMPEMDGLQFLAEMRKKYSGEQIGVIMLTAYEDAEKWDRATAGFVAGYIKKPVVEEELIRNIDKFFSTEDSAAEMTLKTFERHIEKRREYEQEGGTK